MQTLFDVLNVIHLQKGKQMLFIGFLEKMERTKRMRIKTTTM